MKLVDGRKSSHRENLMSFANYRKCILHYFIIPVSIGWRCILVVPREISNPVIIADDLIIPPVINARY